jgi:hypothetical protein
MRTSLSLNLFPMQVFCGVVDVFVPLCGRLGVSVWSDTIIAAIVGYILILLLL